MDKDKIIFYDFASDRTMCLTFISEQLWLCYKHPDGQFVTDRKATIDDISRLCKLKKNNAEADDLHLVLGRALATIVRYAINLKEKRYEYRA